jgi:SAM-dependent methyltransferase
MDDLQAHREKRDDAWTAVQAFYDRHPYPPPVEDLDKYRRRWQDEGKRRADFHLHWPDKAYREDLKILVAGCGTSQAARHALRQPSSQVVGIDISETSVRHTEALKRQYHLANLEVFQLPIERAGDLGRRFDKIVCTGVLHHLPDPDQGLRALREVLEPDGALHLMVYAAYGRAGVYMLQEYCRRLGIGHTDKEIQELAITLTALPHSHPLARLLAESPDFQRKDALADALLNPQDRAYTVPQLFDFAERCGLTFGRWVRQAPYLAHCGSLARTPHAARLAQLPPREQYAAVELFRGTMVRHSVILYRNDYPGGPQPINFVGDAWPGYVPIRMSDTICVQEQLPPGAAAVLINQTHSYQDLFMSIHSTEKRLFDAIDGTRKIGDITASSLPASPQNSQREVARSFFERLWWHDQVMFDASPQPGRDFPRKSPQ